MKLITLIKENIVTLIVAGALAAAFILLRTEPSSLVDESAFNSAVSAGHPTVVEFFSNF